MFTSNYPSRMSVDFFFSTNIAVKSNKDRIKGSSFLSFSSSVYFPKERRYFSRVDHGDDYTLL